MHFDDLVLKRNYLAHSLYDLFTKEIDATILERDELTEADQDIFVDRVHELAGDFHHFTKHVLKADTSAGKLL